MSNEAGDSWHMTEHKADGRYDPPADTVNTIYRRCVNNNGSGWVRLRGSSKTFTATSTGTYTVEIAWLTTDSYGNYTQSGRKGYSSRTIKVDQLVETTWYRLIVSLSGASDKTSFDTDGWTLTANVTAQSVTCVGQPASDATWTTVTTPSITYSWEGVTSSSSTASVGINDVTAGSSGNDKGSGKTIKVTVYASGYNHNSGTYSASVTLHKYGKSYYNG